MARRNDHTRKELHGLILGAARDLAAEKGLDALNVRAIAKMIGYSPGTLYNVFDNVDDLVVHLNAETMDQLYAELMVDMPADPKASLHHMASGYAAFAVDNRPVWQLLFEYAFAEELELPDWYLERIYRLFGIVEAPLSALAPTLPEEKRRDLTFALWSSTHGACTLLIGRSYRIFEPYNAENILRGLVDTFIDGLQAGKGA